MAQVYATLACNLDQQLLAAALPLFEREKVDAIEWSFDALYKHDAIPDWFTDLISSYSKANRLVGHGVFFSLFSGKFLPEQQKWLKDLNILSNQFCFQHISEHFGFMTGEDFHKGAPISLPLNNSTLMIGIDRLKRIQDACNCPVGIENLAFAYNIDEVEKQGTFLNNLLEPINGFLILDLHNLFCQIQNFKIEFDKLLQSFPIHRIHEIHISGGSWQNIANKKIRRDTHDNAVPNEVFNLLRQTMPICKNLKFVVLEQMGSSLTSHKNILDFQEDFEQMHTIVSKHNQTSVSTSTNDFINKELLLSADKPQEDLQLYEQQKTLASILENAKSVEHAKTLIVTSNLAYSNWNCETWDDAMLQTAIAIAQKWKHGW